MFKSSDEDFQVAMIKMIQQAIVNILETNGKSSKPQERNRERKKEKSIKKNEMEILELEK
jgi:hypothetical protein